MNTADTVFIGGAIFTRGQVSSGPAAIAIVDGIIAAIGTDEEIRGWVAPRTEVIDLRGRLLVPGFQDAHVHPVAAGIELLQCNLTQATDADDCLRRIREYADANPDEPWILGGGWSMSFFQGGTPAASLLDDVVPDRPVMLVNRDHHGTWVNSLALELAGIDANTPDPVDGRIERDTAGNPSGTLHEGASELLSGVRPVVNDALAYRGLLRGQQELHSFGITGWQDSLIGTGLGMPDALGVYLRALEEGSLRSRVTGALWWERHEGLEQVGKLIARRDLVTQAARPEMLSAGTVKMMIDGVTENFTAAMTMPYLDVHGHCTDNAGLSFISPEALNTFVSRLDEEGFQVHFHALGDRAVRETLDALEAARASNGPSTNRHHIAHLQVVAAADVPRFAELGVAANIQALWACEDEQLYDLTFPFLAQELIEQHYPFGALAKAGARLVGGSDWPVSTPDPIQAIHVSVNRVTPGGDNLPLGGDRQRLGLAEAITAYTEGSAYINGREESTGSLRVGYRADLAVIDRDLFAVPAERIHEAKVVSTWIDGICVYEGQ